MKTSFDGAVVILMDRENSMLVKKRVLMLCHTRGARKIVTKTRSRKR